MHTFGQDRLIPSTNPPRRATTYSLHPASVSAARKQTGRGEWYRYTIDITLDTQYDLGRTLTVWRFVVGRRDEFSIPNSVRPSVYTLTDRQLADEYRKLTGAPVEVPSSHDPVYWRRWRSDLQLRVLEERVAQLAW